MIDRNKRLFDELKGLELKPGSYAVTGSGPLGVRGAREIKDVDILVSDEYWGELKNMGELIEKDGFARLKLSDNVEAFYSGSFPPIENSALPSIEEQIRDAELIDGLYFVSLPHLAVFKGLSGRDKDREDIRHIENWMD